MTSKTTSLIQFKLLNGDNVIGEMVEDDKSKYYQKMLTVETTHDINNGINYFYFKPFILLQEEIQQQVYLNPTLIGATTYPSKTAIKQYTQWWEQWEKQTRGEVDQDELDHNPNMDSSGRYSMPRNKMH